MTALAIESWRRYFGDQPVVVVDDRSDDETHSYVSRLSKVGRNVRLIESNGLNLARSWNAGVEASQTETVVISNNDVIFTHGGIEAIARLGNGCGIVLPMDQQEARDRGLGPGPEKLSVDYMKSIRDFGSDAVEKSLRLILEIDKWWCGRNKIEDAPVTDPFCRCGGFCFAITKDAYRKIGPFDERYEYYGEDWNYFYRALRHYKIRMLGDWLVWHFGQGTSSTCFGSGERFDRLMRARFMLGEDCEGYPETVSIVMPAYNRPKEVELAIASVIAQTRKDWRLYIIDDGSDAGKDPGTVATRFHDARIGCWRLETNKGPGPARNYGLERTKGKYVAFLDSDDCWSADHLEKHIKAHESGDWEMTYSDASFAWRYYDEQTKQMIEKPGRLPTVDYYGPFDSERLAQRNYIITSSTVWWGEFARSLRFPNMRIEEDWEYFRCVKRGYHLATTTLRYYQTPDGNNLMAEHTYQLSGDSPELIVPMRKRWSGSRVTFVIPTKDRPAQLRSALFSCRKYPTIVVDDGSKNLEAVKAVFDEFPGASLWKGPARGPSSARNMGASLVQTEWIRFLDDDDVATKIADPTIKADAVTLVSAVSRGGVLDLCGPDSVFTSVLQVRTKAFRSVLGFDDSLKWKEERDLLDRMVKAGLSVQHLDEIGALRASSPVMRDWQTGPVHNISSEDIQERRRRR